MTAPEYVLDVLGGASVFKGRTVPTSTELHRRIKRGLPYRSLESVRDRLGLSVLETASVLHMPPRTLARRRQTRKLDPDESDRLYRIARVVSHVATNGKVVIEADVPRRFIERLTTPGPPREANDAN